MTLSILMAKTKKNLNLKIQMLAGKEAKTFFEGLFKNLLSLAFTQLKLFGRDRAAELCQRSLCVTDE